MNDNPLWFFWGQPHMTFLRWLTLKSACRIHDDVRLVVRSVPLLPNVAWPEKQDFQFSGPKTDWMPKIDKLGVEIYNLEDIAPDVAGLGAPDIQTSDLLAWYLLSKYGGTVADMDIVFIKSLPVVEADIQLTIFSGHPRPGYIPVTFMQGRPCAVWSECYERAKASYRFDDYESCGTRNAPDDVAPLLSDHIVYPWAKEYPWSIWSAWLFWSENWPPIPDDCIGLHWYAGHNQTWNQRVRGMIDLRAGAVAWAAKEVLA